MARLNDFFSTFLFMLIMPRLYFFWSLLQRFYVCALYSGTTKKISTVFIKVIIIPSKAREYVFTGVGLSVCVYVCL